MSIERGEALPIKIEESPANTYTKKNSSVSNNSPINGTGGSPKKFRVLLRSKGQNQGTDTDDVDDSVYCDEEALLNEGEGSHIYDLCKNLPNEVKVSAEQAALEVWTDERQRILEVMAELTGISSEDLEMRMLELPNRKGRPKRRKNPWHNLFHL